MILPIWLVSFVLFFFFNDTATTEIYTLSLHDALPISAPPATSARLAPTRRCCSTPRSEEHTSELQSRGHLVCRLLLEKKKIHARLSIIAQISNFQQNYKFIKAKP